MSQLRISCPQLRTRCAPLRHLPTHPLTLIHRVPVTPALIHHIRAFSSSGHSEPSLSLQQTLDIVAQQQRLTPPEYLASLNQVFNAALKENSGTFWDDHRFTAFQAMLVKRLPAFGGADVYRVLTAYARLQYCPEGTLDDLCAALVENLGELSVLQLSHTAVILSALEVTDPTVLESYCQRVREHLPAPTEEGSTSPPSPLDPREATFLALGLSHLGWRDLPTLHGLATLVVEHCSRGKGGDGEGERLSGAQLSTLLLSFATLGVQHPSLYQHLCREIADSLPSLAPQHLANVVLGLATYGDYPIHLMTAIESRLSAVLSLYKTEDLLTVAWSLVALQFFSVDLLAHIGAAMARTLDRTALSQDKERQLHQFSLTIELEAPAEIKEKLVEKGVWNTLYQVGSDRIDTLP